ncbi:N-acetyllactosaminide alpha-1,3-galactosyltransferase-like [Platichthys flesus]|uniref:N-acetyllactosaminide alpha-1,3-galactosyltransferase-like n=1 Tax=Platichthys flesus TaxID=8260 RepID=UPI002DBC0915|nr:N-acetyllactosaminide alpha-1,3-galactosyltransferase-like [Platichthys flesus]
MSRFHNTVKRWGLGLCFLILVFSFPFLYSRFDTHEENPPVPREKEERRNIDGDLNFGARGQVETITSWKGPIMWNGIFDANAYDELHIQLRSSVALTVFAVGRYLDAYCKDFLTSAEKHFMPGLPVTYYVFTDSPEKVPQIELGPQRHLKVIKVKMYIRWQDISMMRMSMISNLIDSEIASSFSHIFCFDVDQVFEARFGSEALGDSVALLHAHYYKLPKEKFTYDRNKKSTAFMETGDFYYHAAIFGGLCANVKNLTDACYLSIMEDKINDVEALWHDESHLNKYYWLNKPSKLLPPEYCWDYSIGDRSNIEIVRLRWAPKHYDTLRANV